MRTNSYRDEEEYDEYDTSGNTVWRRRDEGASWRPPDSRDYWRRRFLVLCAGVVALGACAFLLPGAHHGPARTSASARASISAAAERQSLPPAAYGSAWSSPTPTDSPRPAPSLSASPAAAKPASAAAAEGKPGAKPSAAASAPAGPAGAAPCAPASVVLSLVTSQPAYTRTQMPVFSVYAVSTAAAPCTLPYGDGAVQVVVTSRGHVVWDSATCRPPAAKPVQFTLGVPQVVAMTWNPGNVKPAGCGGYLPARPSGPLDVVAVSHGQSSPVRTFTWDR